jgi:hypothetical protein
MCTGSPPVVDTLPPVLTRRSTLHDASIDAIDGNHGGPGSGVTEVPREPPEDIHFSTDPYSPWPSPVRRHVLPRSDDSFSRISRYSRPESRSGARAPDPPSRRTSLGTIGCNFPVARRVRRLTRNIGLFTRRIHALKTILRKVHRREPAISRSPTPQLPRRRPARASRSSSITTFIQNRSLRTSISSVLSNTLQLWLEVRNQLAYEKSPDHVSITISQYERRGSWLSDDWCGVRHCDVHSTPPRSPGKSVADRPGASIQTESLSGRYVSISLRAGEEASRRRKRTMTWSNSEFDAGLIEYV